MGAGSVSLALPWAVHISDGVLTPAWLAGGFVVASLLALLAAYRVRDEEIPRIAILSAAFFVATLLHLPLGPTRVHLLFNGLVGVVLGRRAPLAILIGIALQSVFGHGGFTTIGINACVMTFPALLAGWMFAGLHYLPWVRQKRSSLLWICGCLVGMTSVLATLILNAVVLLWGGAEDWHQIVWLVFYAHVPLVALEGVVLGFTVSFLARVKPEMLGLPIRYPLSAIRHPLHAGGKRIADSGMFFCSPRMDGSSIITENDSSRSLTPCRQSGREEAAAPGMRRLHHDFGPAGVSAGRPAGRHPKAHWPSSTRSRGGPRPQRRTNCQKRPPGYHRPRLGGVFPSTRADERGSGIPGHSHQATGR
jgi:cobalt/nickel transport system permease protein